MSHAGHERVVYSCGHVARQCRCMGPKTETKLPVACGVCATAPIVDALAAALSRPEAGRDFHRENAAKMFGVPLDQVTKEQRQTAKLRYFQGMYSGGATAAEVVADMGRPTAEQKPPVSGEAEERVLVLNLGLVELYRWWKNGDHPDDRIGVSEPETGGGGATYVRQEGYIVRYFRLPGIDSQRCARCQFSYREHGWIDSGGNGRVVCPGDWVGAIAPGVNFAFSNELVEATTRFPLDLALLNAAHAAGVIGARSDVPDNSLVMGFVHAAKNALGTARGYLDQDEG